MRIFVTSFTILASIVYVATADGLCPNSSWVESVSTPSKCYLPHSGDFASPMTFVSAPSTFFTAVETCEKLGGELISVGSGFENGELSVLYRLSLVPNVYGFWLGMDRETGDWHWLDDSHFSYANWAAGEPNNGSNSLCAIVDNEVNLIWYAVDCTARNHSFICQTNAA